MGVVEVHDKSFVMMEIPGLIEGAHDGVGLGDQFLRHAERARVYIHLLDGLSDDLLSDYLMINDELTQFSPKLIENINHYLNMSSINSYKEYIDKSLFEITTIASVTP